MALDGNYEIKKGDTLWSVAKKQLQISGSKKPTNAQIIAAMKQIAEANGCKDTDECKNKFFNKVGNKLDVTGFSNRAADETFVDFEDGAVQEKPKTKPQDADKKPAEAEPPMLSEEQLKKLKENLGKQLPDITGIDEEQFKKIIEELKKKYPDLFKPIETPEPFPIGTGILTHVKGESGDGSTTKAVGEEGGGMTTMATNEEGGTIGTTKAIGEEGGTIGTTKALGEEGGTNITLAIGENGDATITKGLNESGTNPTIDISWVNHEGGGMTTMALGEEGGGTADTTKAIGEEGGNAFTERTNESGVGMTTKAMGEEGGTIGTTKALGEEGGGTLPVLTDDQFKKIKEIIDKYLKEHPDIFKS